MVCCSVINSLCNKNSVLDKSRTQWCIDRTRLTGKAFSSWVSCWNLWLIWQYFLRMIMLILIMFLGFQLICIFGIWERNELVTCLFIFPFCFYFFTVQININLMIYLILWAFWPYSQKRNKYSPGISQTTKAWFMCLLFCNLI